MPRTARGAGETRGVDSSFFKLVAARACSAAKEEEENFLMMTMRFGHTGLLSTFDTCSIASVSFFSQC